MSSEGSKTRKWKNLGSQMILVATGAVMVLSFQDCGAGFNASSSSSGSAALSSSSSSGGGSVVAPVGKVSSVSPSAQSVNLGTSFSVPVVISSDSVYHGMVSVAVRSSDLAAVDTGAAINFAIDKPSFSLAVNSSQTVNVTVNIPTMSPSFTNQSVHIDVTDVSSKTVLSSAILPLTVNAVYEVNIMSPISTTTENWSALTVGSTTSFIPHVGGLVVRFKNYDSRIHLVHSTGGPIPHESLSTNYPGTSALGMPASADGGTTVGGNYTNTVAAGAASVSQVYDHFLENSSQIRTLKFNQPVPVAVQPTATPIANAATFTQVNTILQSSCVGCHTGASGAGGVDLSTYAGVVKNVTVGNSSVSTLYLVVDGPNPSMPKGGTALSASMVAEIQTWIDAGAKNN